MFHAIPQVRYRDGTMCIDLTPTFRGSEVVSNRPFDQGKTYQSRQKKGENLCNTTKEVWGRLELLRPHPYSWRSWDYSLQTLSSRKNIPNQIEEGKFYRNQKSKTKTYLNQINEVWGGYMLCRPHSQPWEGLSYLQQTISSRKTI